jgi:energy-coupling factor transporter ATP-binding protein EcfA2
MQIKTLKYKQFESSDRYWNIQEIEFESINLLVGKNASGKSKTLSVINGLSNILGENKPLSFSEGDYDVVFKNDSKTYRYILKYHNRRITEEKLILNESDLLIDRKEDGKGIIISSNGNEHAFEIPQNELKANRRDKTNYPYLEDIYFWANHVRLFHFGNDIGKNSLAIKDPTKKVAEFSLKNTDGGLIPTFNSGKKNHSRKFIDKIIEDFNSIGFNIEDVDLGSLASINFQIIENPNVEISALKVKEKDLACWTDQWEMSVGMFRALSVIINFNYYELENIPGVILIDDIGEGLDFERSSRLLELLISKAEKNQNMQLIMSTNDSFVMNSVDLKYWQIIDRDGCQVKYYNQKNSPQTFEDYKFTGLNHFDFFASGFFRNGYSNDLDQN